jgi:DNA polymerase-3 subunit gamma/tau
VNDTLALKYRPSRFSEMVGQDLVSTVLDRMVQNGTVPTALLFAGVRGTGKTSAARILARELNPDMAEPPVLEIDAASNGSVAEIRTIIDMLRYGAAGTRVVIIDECHSMSHAAYNALLKTLEEPPADTVFVLVTTESHKVPETVLSRLITFEFGKIAPLDIARRLSDIREWEKLEAEDELLIFLAQRADGGLRDAVMSLDQCARAGLSTLAEYQSLARTDDVGPSIVATLISGKHDRIFGLMDDLLIRVGQPAVLIDALTGSIRDLMVLKAGGSLSVEGEALENRKQLASLVDPEQLLSAVKVLWELKTRIRVHEHSPSNLALVLIVLSGIFTRG